MKKIMSLMVMLLLSFSFVTATMLPAQPFDFEPKQLEKFEAELVKGDLNNDGVVDCEDVSKFTNILNNGGYRKKADTNGDGVINFIDTFWYLREVGACPVANSNPTTNVAPATGTGNYRPEYCEGKIVIKDKHTKCNDWEAEVGREWSWLNWKWKDYLFLETPNHKVFMFEGQTRVLDGYRFKLDMLSHKGALLNVVEL